MKAQKQTTPRALQGQVLYLKYFQVAEPKSTCFHDTAGENGAPKSSLGTAIPFWKLRRIHSPGGGWNFWGCVKENLVKAIKVSNHSQVISTTCFALGKGGALREMFRNWGREARILPCISLSTDKIPVRVTTSVPSRPSHRCLASAQSPWLRVYCPHRGWLPRFESAKPSSNISH